MNAKLSRVLLGLCLFCTAIGAARCALTKPESRSPEQLADDESLAAATGDLFFEVTQAGGNEVEADVRLVSSADGKTYQFHDSSGKGKVNVEAGKYTAYVYAYYLTIPVLVDIKQIEIAEGQLAVLATEFVEGVGTLGLDAFDRDADWAVDRVELAAQTNPIDPADIPGERRYAFEDAVLDREMGWYKGDLYCQSTYGGGTRSVAELVEEAEKRGLDFLVINDRGTFDHCFDQDYRSDKVVLLPAYEWGQHGQATLLGANTLMRPPESDNQAQFGIRLANAQGATVIVDHPCLAQSPWEWETAGFHAVQVWCSDWRRWPPITPSLLGRARPGVTRNISSAMDLALFVPEDASLSVEKSRNANSQAMRFWEYYLNRGWAVAAVGGSGRGAIDGELGYPTTWVFALSKSRNGILEGIRTGRTFVTATPDVASVLISADSNFNDKFDSFQGSIIPYGREITFEAMVEFKKPAKNVKIEIVKNGFSLHLMPASTEEKISYFRFKDEPAEPSWYRVDVYRTLPPGKASDGFGYKEMLAVTSPIYASAGRLLDPKKMTKDTWLGLIDPNPVKIERTGEVVWIQKPTQGATPGGTRVPASR